MQCVVCKRGRVWYVGRIERWNRTSLHSYGCDRCGAPVVEGDDGPHATLRPTVTADDLYVLAALREIQPGRWSRAKDGSWTSPSGTTVIARREGMVWSLRGDRQITRPLRRLLTTGY